MAQKVKFGLTLSNRGVLLGLTKPSEILEMAELAEASEAFEHGQAAHGVHHSDVSHRRSDQAG